MTYVTPVVFVAGTAAIAEEVNDNFDYVIAGLNASLQADGSVTATGALLLANGTVGAPSIAFGTDPDTGFYRSGANTAVLVAAGAPVLSWASGGVAVTGGVLAASNDGGAIGASGTAFSDLFLASGGVINWAAGDVTITHASNLLVFSGASTAYAFDAPLVPTTNDGAALGSSVTSWSDLFLASGAVFNIAAGNWVATHTSGILTVGTGDLRVTSAGTNAASVLTLNGIQTSANKTLTNPTINAATLTGTLAGTPTFSGAVSFTGIPDFSDGLTVSGGGATAVARVEIGNVQGAIFGIAIQGNSVGSARTMIAFENSAGSDGGSIVTTGTSTAYNTSSDRRLKEDIQPLDPKGDIALIIAALKPSRFNWRVNGLTGAGFIADELQEVIPDAVMGKPDAVKPVGTLYDVGDKIISPRARKPDDDDPLPQGQRWEAAPDGRTVPVYQQVDQSKLVPYLVAALQDVYGRLKALEGRG